MALITVNTREIRSFKLYKQTLNIKNFFENISGNGAFMMCDSLHPTERSILRANLITHNLKLSNLPKNVVRFLFKEKNIKNLLSGNVILVRDFDNNILTEKQITFLLNHEKMTLRFLFSNRTIYRGNQIKTLLNKTIEEKNKKYIVNQIHLPINNIINVILPLSIKSNYIA